MGQLIGVRRLTKQRASRNHSDLVVLDSSLRESHYLLENNSLYCVDLEDLGNMMLPSTSELGSESYLLVLGIIKERHPTLMMASKNIISSVFQ